MDSFQFDYIRERLRSLSWKELFIVLLSCMVVYLLQAKSTYNIHPVWRKMLNSHKDTSDGCKLPQPVIADIESDGINEILVVTKDLQLVVMAMPDIVNRSSRVLPHITIRKSISLNFVVPRWPSVLATGYLTPYLSMIQVRQQVVVVVTNDLYVFCYDHDLNLTWSTQLLPMDQSNDAYDIDSAVAMVTSVTTKRGGQGLVIVGASFSHRSHQKTPSSEHHEHTREHHKHTREQHSLTHFSTFALSGADGSVVWKTTHNETANAGSEPNPPHWKLNLRRHMQSGLTGNNWTPYLIKSLPHAWRSLSDTTMTLASVTHRVSGGSDILTTTSAILTLGQHHIAGYAYGGHRPHTPQEHTAHPDAVIIHHSRGAQAVSLSNGKFLSGVDISADGSVFVDIKNDNSVEKISVVSRDKYSDCRVHIQTLSSQPGDVSEIPLCDNGGIIWSTQHREDMGRTVTPIVIPSVSQRSGILQHLRGDNLLRQSHEYDILVHLSSGRIVSLSPDGFLHWEAITKSGWYPAAAAQRLHHSNDDGFASFFPSLQPLSLRVFGKPNWAIVSGWDHLTLIDLRSGTVLAQHSLPCRPLSRTVIGDFDNDGLNDFIATCDIGYIGFIVTPQPQHLWTAVYAATVFVSIVLLTIILSHIQQTDDEHSQ